MGESLVIDRPAAASTLHTIPPKTPQILQITRTTNAVLVRSVQKTSARDLGHMQKSWGL